MDERSGSNGIAESRARVAGSESVGLPVGPHARAGRQSRVVYDHARCCTQPFDTPQDVV